MYIDSYDREEVLKAIQKVLVAWRRVTTQESDIVWKKRIHFLSCIWIFAYAFVAWSASTTHLMPLVLGGFIGSFFVLLVLIRFWRIGVVWRGMSHTDKQWLQEIAVCDVSSDDRSLFFQLVRAIAEEDIEGVQAYADDAKSSFRLRSLGFIKALNPALDMKTEDWLTV